MKLPLLILLLTLAFNVQGATWPAATASRNDVNTAVGLASDGDTVTIPNGNVTWTDGITTTKQIIIRAANYTPTEDGSTTRNVTITNNNSSSIAIFRLTTGNSFHVGIGGIAIHEGTGTAAALMIDGSGSKVPLIFDSYFQINNRSFDDGDEILIDLLCQGGVMWNCYIDGEGFAEPAGPGGSCMKLRQPRAWASASTWGAADTGGVVNFYIEDSTFFNASFQTPDVDGSVAGSAGSRAVVRYSTIDGTTGLTHGFTSVFPGRHIEYYNNIFRVSDDFRNHNGRYFWLRGGTAIFTDNTINNSDNPSEYGNVTLCDVGDSTTPGSYPMNMGPGQGWVSGSFASEPVYIWGNSLGSGASYWSVDSEWASNFQLNRDIFLSAKPGYSKYTYPHPLRTQVDATPDTTAPTPNPMTFASAPAAVDAASITMTATAASDASAVEYFFDETTGTTGGTDSGWQSSATYVDSGLSGSTQYTYRVKARDTALNETSYSSTASATTTTATGGAVNIETLNVGNLRVGP